MSAEKEALKKAFIDARTPKLFSKKIVSDELLKELYELVKLGPTSGNCSPSRYVFLKTDEEKEKLKIGLAPGNVDKLFSAPVIVLSCIDPFFFNALPRIGSEPDLRDWFVRDVGMSEEVSMRNSSIQGGYLIIAARLLGLDVMPISGFDPILVEENLLKKEGWHINFIAGLGYSDSKTELDPRLPRLDFDEACRLR